MFWSGLEVAGPVTICQGERRTRPPWWSVFEWLVLHQSRHEREWMARRGRIMAASYIGKMSER